MVRTGTRLLSRPKITHNVHREIYFQVMLDDENMVIDDFTTAECIIAFMKVNDNVDDEEHGKSDIGDSVEFRGKLILPKSGSEPQSQRYLYLKQVDCQDYQKIPCPCFGVQWIYIK